MELPPLIRFMRITTDSPQHHTQLREGEATTLLIAPGVCIDEHRDEALEDRRGLVHEILDLLGFEGDLGELLDLPVGVASTLVLAELLTFLDVLRRELLDELLVGLEGLALVNVFEELLSGDVDALHETTVRNFGADLAEVLLHLLLLLLDDVLLGRLLDDLSVVPLLHEGSS